MDRLSLLDTTLRTFDSSLPRLVQARCVATRYRASACRRCAEVCPVDAITLAPLTVDADRCIACGACAAVCRTGALDYPQPRMLVHESLTGGAGYEATVACSQADLDAAESAAGVVVACLAGLSGADLIAAAAAGCDRVALVSGDCASCPAGPAMTRTRPEIAQTVSWLDAVGVPVRVETVVTPPSGHPMEPPATTVSRRNLFGLLFGRGRSVAAAAIASPKPTVEDLHAVTPPPAVQRRLLADLAALRDRVAASGPLPRSVPLAGVDIAEACDGCGLCARYCPHGALTPADGRVAVAASLCTGCELCAETCPRGAVSVRPAQVALSSTRCSAC